MNTQHLFHGLGRYQPQVRRWRGHTRYLGVTRAYTREMIQEETLVAIEWPRVCAQIARFAYTAMGKEKAQSCGLRMASKVEDALNLCTQTEIALDVLQGSCEYSFNRDVVGKKLRSVMEVQPWLDAMHKGKLLDVREADAVISTIESALEVVEIVETMREVSFQPLKDRLGNRIDKVRDLHAECRKAVKPGLLYLDVDASTKLKNVRTDLRDNEGELRVLLQQIAQTLYNEGASDEAQVVIRRERFCIPVKRGMQGLLKKGLTLAESKTGQTVYMEPSSAVEFNNRIVMLRSEEEKEQNRILKRISKRVVELSSSIEEIFDVVVEFDLIFARANHASWTRGTKPAFMPQTKEGECAQHLSLLNVVHPVLLEPYLDQGDEEIERPPVPIDIVIPGEADVVTISGPNTGGKTASLKTIALCLTMAKSGMFIRTESAPPLLQWFDYILADIGDRQSVEADLSTFSSHITRIRDIVRVSDKSTLVLLDEVGSGTNPKEGSALASAILIHLSQCTGLTIATTHFTELKRLSMFQEKFFNACVEFNTETLKPTYQLLWGESGASNALEIARAIGLSKPILDDATTELGHILKTESADVKDREKVPVAKIINDLKAQNAAADGMKTLSKDLADQLQRIEIELREEREEIKQQLFEDVENYYDNAAAGINESIQNLVDGEWDQSQTETSFKAIEKSMRQNSMHLSAYLPEDADVELNSTIWRPRIGERVRMRRFGGSRAIVTQFNDKTMMVTLKKGNVSLTASISDITPI